MNATEDNCREWTQPESFLQACHVNRQPTTDIHPSFYTLLSTVVRSNGARSQALSPTASLLLSPGHPPISRMDCFILFQKVSGVLKKNTGVDESSVAGEFLPISVSCKSTIKLDLSQYILLRKTRKDKTFTWIRAMCLCSNILLSILSIYQKSPIIWKHCIQSKTSAKENPFRINYSTILAMYLG